MSNYKTLKLFQDKLDYKTRKLKDRQDLVDDIVEEDFFSEYFDNHFNVHYNQDSNLAEKDEVCSFLEKLGSYLLMSEEVLEERKQNKEFKFYCDEKALTRNDRSNFSIDDLLESTGLEDIGQLRYIDISGANKKNYKKVSKQQIYKADILEDSECGKILKEYEDFIEICKKRRSQGGNKYKLDTIIGNLKKDQLITKTKLKGTIIFQRVLNGGFNDIDYSCIDYTNEDIMKKLLVLCPEKYKNEVGTYMNVIMMDLENMIERANLNDTLYSTIQRRRLGYSLQEIAEMDGITHVGVILRIKKACKKIIEANREG